MFLILRNLLVTGTFDATDGEDDKRMFVRDTIVEVIFTSHGASSCSNIACLVSSHR